MLGTNGHYSVTVFCSKHLILGQDEDLGHDVVDRDGRRVHVTQVPRTPGAPEGWG